MEKGIYKLLMYRTEYPRKFIHKVFQKIMQLGQTILG